MLNRKLDRPALFALIPARGRGITVEALMKRAGLAPSQGQSVRNAIKTWRGLDAVINVGRIDRCQVLYRRLWSEKHFREWMEEAAHKPRVIWSPASEAVRPYDEARAVVSSLAALYYDQVLLVNERRAP